MDGVDIISLLIVGSSSGWAGDPCKICSSWTPLGSIEVELSVAVFVATQPWTYHDIHVSKKQWYEYSFVYRSVYKYIHRSKKTTAQETAARSHLADNLRQCRQPHYDPLHN
jgi:hypothetical protein